MGATIFTAEFLLCFYPPVFFIWEKSVKANFYLLWIV